MGALTVVANGQSLTVDINAPSGDDQPAYSDADLTSAVTLPLAITDDTVFYFPAGTNLVTVTVTTPAGATLISAEPHVVGDNDQVVLTPLPTAAQVAAAGSPGTLKVANSAAGTTLGAVVKKVEVFDAAGTSLGFLPVYDGIT